MQKAPIPAWLKHELARFCPYTRELLRDNLKLCGRPLSSPEVRRYYELGPEYWETVDAVLRDAPAGEKKPASEVLREQLLTIHALAPHLFESRPRYWKLWLGFLRELVEHGFLLHRLLRERYSRPDSLRPQLRESLTREADYSIVLGHLQLLAFAPAAKELGGSLTVKELRHLKGLLQAAVRLAGDLKLPKADRAVLIKVLAMLYRAPHLAAADGLKGLVLEALTDTIRLDANVWSYVRRWRVPSVGRRFAAHREEDVRQVAIKRLLERLSDERPDDTSDSARVLPRVVARKTGDELKDAFGTSMRPRRDRPTPKRELLSIDTMPEGELAVEHPASRLEALEALREMLGRALELATPKQRAAVSAVFAAKRARARGERAVPLTSSQRFHLHELRRKVSKSSRQR